MYLVKRTCTRINEDGESPRISRSLADWSGEKAYVLLGDPGAGKTTAFRMQADEECTYCVTARDFITYQDRPQWRGKTLFIDGLDEVRAGSSDGRTPLDKIRRCLDKLGRPRFRLSCREADWFGAADREALQSVAPAGKVTVLQLDPLSDANIVEILTQDACVPDPDDFVHHARENGLYELLGNPQILEMLVKAVPNHSWPDSRMQTFEFFCQNLIQEHNREHQMSAWLRAVDQESALDAAGRVCAVQLLSGSAGFALSTDGVERDYASLGDVSTDDNGLQREVVKSKLFHIEQGRVTPIHRHIAEFLAARYLARCIDRDGLPLGRVLALISGVDGIVVSEMRGISAWLATLCTSRRGAIIERDPLGVVLYGDVQDFTRAAKRQVLDGLLQQASRYPWFRDSSWESSPFGRLATADMEADLNSILTDPDRGDAHQALAECVVDAVSHGARLPTLDAALRSIVRDDSWWPRVRHEALSAILRIETRYPGSDLGVEKLREEIATGDITDADDELMGSLLNFSYPHRLGVDRVLDYFHVPKKANHFGSYRTFWTRQILELSSDSDVRAILDQLSQRQDQFRPALDDYHFHDVAGSLLARGLEVYGEALEPAHLYQWFAIGLDCFDMPRQMGQEYRSRILDWLVENPQVYEAIIDVGLKRCAGEENFAYCMDKVRARMLYAQVPVDFGQWCLKRLKTADNDRISRFLLQQAVDTLRFRRGAAGLTLETILALVEGNAKQKAWLDEMLVCPIDEKKPARTEKSLQRRDEERKQKQEWLDFAKSGDARLPTTHAHIGVLADMARVYSGAVKGDTPGERLASFLEHDDALVQAALKGLRLSLQRDDIPDVEEIINTHLNGERYRLSQPFMVGMEEASKASVDRMSDRRARQAVAFYLVDGHDQARDWYQALAKDRPQLVSEVLTTYVIAALRANKQVISGVYALADVDAYQELARMATLKILNAFPTRAGKQQQVYLDALLKAALRHANKKKLDLLIRKKLALRSMKMSQRICWLAAGMILNAETYAPELLEYARGHERRVACLVEFLADLNRQRIWLGNTPTSVLGGLVRLIGRYFAPFSMEHGGAITTGLSAASLLRYLIDRLGSQPGPEPAALLHDLLIDPELLPWRPTLQDAAFQQAALSREACFQHADVGQVVDTLRNAKPANAADLAALTVDVLQELGDQIRNGNTDDYRQYWNTGTGRKLNEPRHENDCRNALLSDLAQRLAPFEIDTQPEGHYADDKRADIRVSVDGSNGCEVPIEIKKNTDTKLWTAMHRQLIPRYTREPNAHGFGIYLVFWFGPDYTQPPPSGTRPRTANELKKRLVATLSEDEKRKISVVVVDVAVPKREISYA